MFLAETKIGGMLFEHSYAIAISTKWRLHRSAMDESTRVLSPTRYS